MAGILTLSGWGQPHDALSTLAPDATHLDYTRHANVEEALADIAAHSPETVIGWSLGGQLASHAIARGLIKPKHLVLLATPFQFVASPEFPLGMKRDLYDKFHGNYARDPARTLNKSWELLHKDDIHADRIRAHLMSQDKNKVLEKDWLRWLSMLDGFGFDPALLADFPPTLLIHGDKDVVVAHDQSEYFAKAIPRARLVTLKDAGHAPHWHDNEAVKRLILEHTNV